VRRPDSNLPGFGLVTEGNTVQQLRDPRLVLAGVVILLRRVGDGGAGADAN
jgi:hypothetical protein